MKLTYLGHSCVLVETSKATVVFDPFLTGNPKAARQADSLNVDAVLVTHGHFDHVGDAASIAKRCGAPVVGVVEVVGFLEKQGVQGHGLNIGGAHQFEFGRVKLVQAQHSSSAVDESGAVVYMGNPAGILFEADGRTILHAGDTGLFGDMRLIGERHSIDLALLPIGDNFTMGPDDAVEAVKLLRPKAVVPVHYNTFGLIAQDGKAFAERVRALGTACYPLEPGESVTV